MSDSGPFVGEPADTKEVIMRATYRALQRYGYAELSIGRIAEEADLSKSAFYNHYDGKDDLLLAFLDFMLDRIAEAFIFDESDDPVEDLRIAMTVAALGNPMAHPPRGPGQFDSPGDVPRGAPDGAFIELRANAVSDADYRSRFEEIDATLADHIGSILRRGIDAGVFRKVDPDRTAELLLSLFMGVMLRRTTSERFDNERVRAELDDLLATYLLVEE